MRIARVDEGWARLSEAGAHLYDRAPWCGGTETGAVVEDYRLGVPTAPSKIVCVGRNYRAHAEELGNEVPKLPLLFLKPPSALLATDRTVQHPSSSERVDFEGEVAIVIGLRARAVTPPASERHIFGITCANDITARDLQRADSQFTRGKGFDTFCPCGPWIETEFGALDTIEINTTVDGELRQHGSTSQMIWGIADLISYISHIMTLEPGDLVLTGTPEGVGPLTAGQIVQVTVRGVGTLTSTMGERTVP